MTLARKASGCAVLLAAIVAAIWLSRGKPAPSAPSGETIPLARPRSAPPDADAALAAADTAAHRRVLDDWAALLRWLRSTPPPTDDEIRARLLATRIAWTTLDPHALAEALGHLLAAGKDAETGLDFKVGNHGQLAGWPTLRVFLLDLLATSDPERAAAIARGLLDTTASADEFATALRSLTRKGPALAPDSELLSRFGQMLARPDWQDASGFAEALDLPRRVGSADAARLLATWPGNPALKAMAMAEFAADHPAAMLETLATDTNVEAPLRASLMARADPADPGQLAAVDAYLRHPDRSADEATDFLKSFPLRSATTGFRLYGASPSPYNFERIKAGDLAASGQVATWLADPALEKYRPALEPLQQRLAEWIDQAK